MCYRRGGTESQVLKKGKGRESCVEEGEGPGVMC